MAWIVASASKGIMDAVLEKLNGLIVDRFVNLIGLPNNISFLMDELYDMRALLRTLEDTDLEDPDVKGWSDLAREMVYDIEDLIDHHFMVKHESADANAGFLKKLSNSLQTFRSHIEDTSEINELRVRLQVIHERRGKKPRAENNSSPSTTYNNPRVSALFNEADNLVGINGPKEELINQVDDPSHQLKVLSIVGSGGSGKTTLANAVYREIGGQFDCMAFVSVSQKPTMPTLLNGLLSKLTGTTSPPDTYCAEDELIEKLRAYLYSKRYVIVVDDLWGVQEWNTISWAFPNNSCCSRVIITTRHEYVARACSNLYGRFIYKMKSLSHQDSRKLFFNRIFGSEVCPGDFTESDEILKKCSGLPFAIITIASILACERPGRNQRIKWEFIKTSLAAQLPTNNPTLEDMMDILNLSYKSLPNHLKQCFLYLGIYPEDHRIGKTDLLRQWVVEGFVRQNMAESYFNELVNRSMIQPEYDEPEYDEEGLIGEVRGCKVHDMMLDLILRRCAEDNFIRFLHDGREVAERPRYKIRRLTVNWRGAEDCRIPEILSSHLSHLRCLTMFGTSECIPHWSEFKFLRVLFIEIRRPGIILDLTDISQLFLLRSLKVFSYVRDQTIVLPDEIRMLRYLERFELPVNSNFKIPSDIGDLSRLSHLNVPSSSALPEGIGKAKSLRTINGFCLLESSSQSIEGLGQLTNMEELIISTKRRYPRTDRWMAALSSSLDKLGNLKVLVISCHNVHFCADAMNSCTPSHKFEQLNLYNLTFSRVPRWMRGLRYLRELWLGVMQLEQEDVDMIGTGLQSLGDLNLRIPGVTAERIVISGSTGFSVLKSLSLDWDGMYYLTFEAGAMPKLQELHLEFNPQPREWDVSMPAGLQHLSSLKTIYPCTVGPESQEMQDMIERVFELSSHLRNQPDVCVDHVRSERWIEVREDGQERQV